MQAPGQIAGFRFPGKSPGAEEAQRPPEAPSGRSEDSGSRGAGHEGENRRLLGDTPPPSNGWRPIRVGRRFGWRRSSRRSERRSRATESGAAAGVAAGEIGSRGRARTFNPSVNSRLLYH